MIKKIWTGILICVALLTLSFAAFAETAGDFSRYAGTWQEKGENGGRIVIRADGGFVHADADNVLDMEGTLERGSEEIGGTVHRTIRMTDHFGKLDDVFYDDEEGELTSLQFGNGDAPAFRKTEAPVPDTALPEYSYAGDDEKMKLIVEWLKQEKGQYLTGDVWLPAPVILLVDDANPEDIRVFGNFWCHWYSLYGTCLVTESGGETPAVFHFAEKDGKITLKNVETAGDGTDYSRDIKHFCTGYEGLADRFFKATEEEREACIASVIREYRDQNALAIDAYGDLFWPVKLL